MIAHEIMMTQEEEEEAIVTRRWLEIPKWMKSETTEEKGKTYRLLAKEMENNDFLF
mgnify:CR=1 FL=1